MKRCSKCILPANYPGIVFDKHGVCSHCNTHQAYTYLGGEVLKNHILAHAKTKPQSNYHCGVGFSGGRDSSYLLYYLSHVLNLKVVAFTIDNGFIPEETFSNIKNITRLLGVDLAIVRRDQAQKLIKHHISTWCHEPSVGMVPALCVGCRSGLAEGLYTLAVKHDVPVFISGSTPFEGHGYKTNLMRHNPNSRSKSSLMLGYSLEIVKNPKWALHLPSLTTQFNEFRSFFGGRYLNKMAERGTKVISPYFQYIRWEEKEIVSTLENRLNWKKNSMVKSTWRGDCDVALLKLYLYKHILGFNDKDDGLSDLIRDGQLSREEALNRIEEESYVPDIAIKNIFDRLKLNYGDFETALEKLNRRKATLATV
ncbi:MAG: hypothetical protein HGB19_05590 [Chlorobiales bacterium]|jgi:hypothetical protein|nr:hypothetical protein [Chlorobiales bacterium]